MSKHVRQVIHVRPNDNINRMIVATSIKPVLDGHCLYVISSFIDEGSRQALCEEALQGPSRRTCLGGQACEWWTEYGVRPEGRLSQALTGTYAYSLLKAADGLNRWQPQMWVHHYANGERIPWHRDAAGDLQLVLCLLAPPAVNGGLFLLRPGSRTVSVDLRPGDAVIFKATKILHSTTRLRPTAELPKPERMVAVARFYKAME